MIFYKANMQSEEERDEKAKKKRKVISDQTMSNHHTYTT